MPAPRLNIVADANMPQVEAMFADIAHVTLINGRQIERQHLLAADVLLVRSVTKVTPALLNNTSVQYVGSATAGVDHIDPGIINHQTIGFVNAAGANANSVAEYVLAALCQVFEQDQHRCFDFTGCVGVVGAGHVGSAVARLLLALGFSVKVYDPFVVATYAQQVSTLNELSDCDIICVHTPLTKTGVQPTENLVGHDFLSRLKRGTIVLSAGRGGVVNEAAMKEAILTQSLVYLADVWQSEPVIDADLLALAYLATPHIAGYSFDSKIKATQILREAVNVHFALPATSESQSAVALTSIKADPAKQGIAQFIDVVLQVFPIKKDDTALRSACGDGAAFDALRANYWQRFEYSNFRVAGLDARASVLAQAAGFYLE